ncbi:MAG: hypothetical protein GY679_01380 [Mycoplasma sp.]|nr:hypothetical protein [Mycoplasma sp.]
MAKSINDVIKDKNIKNQVFNLRFRNNTVKTISNLVNKADLELQKKILSQSTSPLTKSREKQIQKWIGSTNKKVAELTNEEIEKQYKELIENQIEFQKETIDSTIPKQIEITTVKPTFESVWKTAMIRPFQTKKFKQWFSDWDNSRKQVMTNEVKLGLIQGKTNQQIVRELFGTKANNYKDGKMQGTRSQIQTAVRTTTNHILNQTKDTFYKANDDMIKGYEWVSTLDNRTSLICASLDGKVDYYDGSRRELNGETPPAHPNSVIKGTLITTKRGLIPIEEIKAGDYVLTHRGRFMRAYNTLIKKNDRTILKLKSSDGVGVSLTDDHPILTHNKGWVNAGDVDIGDVIFQNFHKFSELPNRVFSFVTNRVLLNSHNRKTKVRQELISLGIFSFSASVPPTINFKNHFSKNKVCNVFVNLFLEIKGHIESVFKKIKKIFFMKRWVVSHKFAFAFDCLNKNISFKKGVFLFHSFRRFSKNVSIFFWILFEGMIFSFGSVYELLSADKRIISTSYFYGELFTPFKNSCFANPKFSLYKSNRLPKLPMFFFDEFKKFFFCVVHKVMPPVKVFSAATIISIEEKKVNDFVYNLSVEGDETYIANGIILHNCRSTTVPITKSWKELGVDKEELPPSTRASMNGQVSERITYPEWLKSQSAKTQKDVLGSSRYKAFKNGDAKITQFVDNKNNILTIEQLKAKNIEINGGKKWS